MARVTNIEDWGPVDFQGRRIHVKRADMSRRGQLVKVYFWEEGGHRYFLSAAEAMGNAVEGEAVI